MIKVIKYIRPAILTAAGIIATAFIGSSYSQITVGNYGNLVRSLGLASVAFLYLSLLASPLYIVFPHFPYKPVYIKARRAIGVAAFFFAILHGSFALFGELGGIQALSFLTGSYLLAIWIGIFNALALTLLAATSFDSINKLMGKNWKRLHQTVYIVAVLVLVHVILIEVNFRSLNPTSVFGIVVVLFLLTLEGLRLYKYIQFKKYAVSKNLTI